MGCFSPDAPAPIDYGKLTSDTLQTQLRLAPEQYASEAQYQPLYANLELQNLNRLLNGVPAGPQTMQVSRGAEQTGWYDASGKFISPGTTQTSKGGHGLGAALGMPFLGGKSSSQVIPGTAPAPGAVWRNAGEKFMGTSTTDAPATPGLFAMLQQQNTNQRQGDINDVANLGPQATQAMLAANPYNATLLQKLNAQANEGLDAGTGLTPDQARAMQQNSRAAFAARGMGGSNAGISDELLKQFNLGQQLQMQRQAFAQSVVGNNQAVMGDPFQQILARQSGAIPAAYQGQQQAGPSLFNPESALSSKIASGNQAYAAMFADPSTMNKIGQVSNTVGSFVGSIAGGMI